MKTNAQAMELNQSYLPEIYTADLPFSPTEVIRYKAIKEHLCCELNGEAVILSLKNGKYYGLNPVASRIWELIQTPLSTDEIQNSILLEYDVESEMCEREVSTFLNQMAAEELIVVINEKVQELF